MEKPYIPYMREVGMNGAALYLHLTALGLSLAAVEDRGHRDGFVIIVEGLSHLDPRCREDARWLLRTRKAALLALLLSGSPDALDVR